MSSTGRDLSLSRLLENVRTLDAKPAPAGRAHPLDLPGMRSDHAWRPPGRSIELPVAAEALKFVRTVVEAPIHGLGELSLQGWAALINRPTAIVGLRADIGELQAEGFDVPSGTDRARLHHVGLAVATQTRDPAFDSGGRLVGDRLVGVGRAVVVAGAGRHSKSTWAGLVACWHPDATRAARALQDLQERRSGSWSSTGLRKVYVLGGHEQVPGTDNLVTRVRAAGTVLGFDVQWLPRPKHLEAQTRKSVSAEPPAALLVWQTGEASDQPDAMFASELRRSLKRPAELRRIAAREGASLIEGVRDALMQIAGIGHGLLLVPAGAAPGTAVSLPPSGGETLQHNETGRTYHEDPIDGTYWSRDDAGHAGTAFKQYRKFGAALIHVACCDEAGMPIEKHKGAKGARIPLKDLHASDRPR